MKILTAKSEFYSKLNGPLIDPFSVLKLVSKI